MDSIRRIRRHASGMNKKSEFMQVMYLDFDSSSGDHLRRGRKIYKESLPKQKKMNEKRARRYFEALVEANFKGGKDLVLHLTFSKENYPASEEEAKQKVKAFLRNVNGKRKRRGLGNAKYIVVFETSKTGRFHFHLLMDGEMDRDEVEKTWKHGYCNANRLKADPRDGLTAIINYLAKGGESEANVDKQNCDNQDSRSKWQKRWIPSRGLVRPWISEGKVSRKKFKIITSLPEDSELLIQTIEQDNAGYRLQSVERTYCEQVGRWYVFSRMRLKDKEAKTNISTGKIQKVDKTNERSGCTYENKHDAMG